MEFTYPVIPKNIISRSNANEKNEKRCNSPHQSGRKMSSRTSALRPRYVACFSEKLGPLRYEFKGMSDKLHQFSSECNIDVISPSLMAQFKILEKEYDKFCSQANTILNSIHPSKSLSNSLVTSTNIKQANLLVSEWIELIKQFNSITSDGLMPHFQLISKEFDTLKKTVKNIVQLFSNSNLMPSINPSLVRKIYTKIDEYKHYYFELYRKVEFHKTFQYDAEKVLPNIQKLINSIGNIFLFELPNITMSTSEVMMKKNQMTYHCEYLLNLINGTAKFTFLGNESIECFKKVNEQFKLLFGYLKIPFSLELTFYDMDDAKIEEEEEVDEEANNTITDDESILQNQKSVDLMRKRIKDMQNTILAAHLKDNEDDNDNEDKNNKEVNNNKDNEDKNKKGDEDNEDKNNKEVNNNKDNEDKNNKDDEDNEKDKDNKDDNDNEEDNDDDDKEDKNNEDNKEVKDNKDDDNKDNEDDDNKDNKDNEEYKNSKDDEDNENDNDNEDEDDKEDKNNEDNKEDKNNKEVKDNKDDDNKDNKDNDEDKNNKDDEDNDNKEVKDDKDSKDDKVVKDDKENEVNKGDKDNEVNKDNEDDKVCKVDRDNEENEDDKDNRDDEVDKFNKNNEDNKDENL